MSELKKMITDEAIEKAWGNANFGPNPDKREIIKDTLLKIACGYNTGHTAKQICNELGLLKGSYKLSKKGGAYLYQACTEPQVQVLPVPGETEEYKVSVTIPKTFTVKPDEIPEEMVPVLKETSVETLLKIMKIADLEEDERKAGANLLIGAVLGPIEDKIVNVMLGMAQIGGKPTAKEYFEIFVPRVRAALGVPQLIGLEQMEDELREKMETAKNEEVKAVKNHAYHQANEEKIRWLTIHEIFERYKDVFKKLAE